MLAMISRLHQLLVVGSGFLRLPCCLSGAASVVKRVEPVRAKLQGRPVLNESLSRTALCKQHVRVHLPCGDVDFGLTDAILTVGCGADQTKGFLVVFVREALPRFDSSLGGFSFRRNRAVIARHLIVES